MHQCGNLLKVDWSTSGDRHSQRVGDGVLADPSRHFQQFHIRLVRHFGRVGLVQHVVRDAKLAGGKHLFAEAIVGKGPRLTHQRINHMAVINRKAFLAKETRHRLHKVILISHQNRFSLDSHVNFPTDQPAGDRVSVGAYLNRAAAVDAHAVEQICDVQPVVGKTLKDRLFLGKTILSMSVGLGDNRFDEAHVVFAGGEGAAATQQQRLIDPLLKMPIGRLNVAIFIGTPRVGSFSLAAVMLHQRGVSRGVGFATGVVVDRSAERVAAVTLWHAAKFPKRFLNPRAQRLKRFRKTETDRFDVAVRQDAVKQGMVKTSAGDLDAEAVANSEIAGCQAARMVELWKHDRLAGAKERLPFRNPSLERSPSRIGKFAGSGLRHAESIASSLLLSNCALILKPSMIAPNIFKRRANPAECSFYRS